MHEPQQSGDLEQRVEPVCGDLEQSVEPVQEPQQSGDLEQRVEPVCDDLEQSVEPVQEPHQFIKTEVFYGQKRVSPSVKAGSRARKRPARYCD